MGSSIFPLWVWLILWALAIAYMVGIAFKIERITKPIEGLVGAAGVIVALLVVYHWISGSRAMDWVDRTLS